MNVLPGIQRWRRTLGAPTLLFSVAAVLLCGSLQVRAGQLDSNVQQMVLSIAPAWNSDSGRLELFEKTGPQGWKAVGAPWPVLYGRNGLVWGRGVLGTDEPGPHKAEKDKRAPAGVFKIGRIYTYDNALPEGASYPFHTVTPADAWVDDPASPDYNRFVTIPDSANPPPWFEKAKMRQNDSAYRWLVEIRHNSDPPAPGCGSAIFFHIRRGVDRPTAGCTTMAESNLVKIVCWLRAAKDPHYALLPKSEYEQKWRAWGLPSPAEASALLAN